MNRTKMLPRRILLALVAGCLITACTPSPKRVVVDASPLEMADQVDAVLVGTVTSVESRLQLVKWGEGKLSNVLDRASYSLSSMDVLVVELEVKEMLKGVDSGRTTLSVNPADAVCGLDLAPGDEYLIYAFEVDGNLYTNSCMRTAPAAGSEVEIGELRDYFTESSSEPGHA